MAASAALAPTIKNAPKTPDTARRHYVTLAWRLRSALADARRASADPDSLQDIAERYADARELAARARAWGRRSASRGRVAPARSELKSHRRRRTKRTPPVTARQAEVVVAQRSVPDPYEPGAYITTSYNRRVDVLANEHGAGHITDAQFQVGRMIQAIYERASGAKLRSRGYEPSPSWDRTIAHELAVIYSLDDATLIVRFTARLERAIGAVGARFLRAILTEGHTFASYAAARGKASERGAAQVGAHFRFLLEGLTEAQHTARGPRPSRPVDKFSRLAETARARPPSSSEARSRPQPETE